MIMILDMLKAHDRLNWEFLIKVLKAFGFSDSWCDMVVRSFNSCHYGILIKGKLHGFFSAKHGIRQGDPFSSALYILASEYLSRGLNHLFNSSPELFYDSKKGLKVSHLAYADDLILFTKGYASGVKKIMNFIQHYENDVFVRKRASTRLI